MFGYVSPFEKRPDLGSYTPKTKRNPTFALMRKPIQKAEASLEFFENRKTLKSMVGPTSYMCMPNIQKTNGNPSTFGKANRRFMFN